MPLSTFLNGRYATTARGLMFLSLSDTAVIQTRSYTDDAGGGGTMTYANAGTAACRIDPLTSGARGVTGGRIDERSTHLVTVPSGTNVSLDGRAVIAGRGTFEITALRERTAEWATYFEVLEAS